MILRAAGVLNALHLSALSHRQNQIRVMELERQKMGALLKKRLREIQKYKNIEAAQEERLKNMFEHLRQLDIEIQDFTENTDILEAKNENQMPEKVVLEQQKVRDRQHHDMKLLEFDLQTMQQKVQRDLQAVIETADNEVLGIDPKYVNEQVRNTIQEAIANLQSKVHLVLQ